MLKNCSIVFSFKGNSIDFDGLKGLFKKFFQKVDLGDLSISDLKSLAGRLATLLKDSNINVQSLSIDELKQYIKSADFSKCDSPTDLQNFISKKNSDLKNVKDIDDFRDGCSDQLNDMAKAEQSQTGKAGGGSKAGKGSKSGGSSSSSSSG